MKTKPDRIYVASPIALVAAGLQSRPFVSLDAGSSERGDPSLKPFLHCPTQQIEIFQSILRWLGSKTRRSQEPHHGLSRDFKLLANRQAVQRAQYLPIP